MSASPIDLRPFARRVRAMRAWRGLAVGMLLGALLALALSVLGWLKVVSITWESLVALVGCAGALGAALGAAWKVRQEALARSIDRRAGTLDRLTTAIEPGHEQDELMQLQHRDAQQAAEALRPARVFPMRFGRWQAGALGLSVLAAAVFLLGNTPILLSDEERKERDELAESAVRVERVAKPIAERKPEAQTAAEREYAKDLERYARELKRGEMDREAALAKANELSQEAQQLMQERYQQVDNRLQMAQSALDQMLQDELRKQGLEGADLEQLKSTPQELDRQELSLSEERSRLQQQSEALTKAMQSLQQKLNQEGLSPEERQAIQEQLESMGAQRQSAQDALGENQKAMQQLQLSREAQQRLQELMQSKEFKELQELAEKLRQAAEQAQQGEQQPLTQEQIEQMQEQLRQLEELLKDEEALKQYMEQLREALEQAELAMQNGQGMGLMSMLSGMPIAGMPGQGGRSQDNSFADTGKVPTGEEQDIDAKGVTTSVTGSRREEGQETYIEVRGPTTLGTRSSVPLRQALPQYRRTAEDALNKERIPKRHVNRVREYYESLEGGKK